MAQMYNAVPLLFHRIKGLHHVAEVTDRTSFNYGAATLIIVCCLQFSTL